MPDTHAMLAEHDEFEQGIPTGMPPYEDQVSQYSRIPEPGSPRQTEAWALIEAAKRLAAGITHGPDDDKETRSVRKAALRLNWKLWTIFQAEVSRPERSDLPEDIQLNMLTLCQFVDKQTVGALVNPTAEALSVLIDLNRHIAAGLSNVPEDSPIDEQAESMSAAVVEMRQRIDTEV